MLLPILADGIINFNKLHVMASRFPNTQIKLITDKNHKIVVHNDEQFKALSAALNSENYCCHTQHIQNFRDTYLNSEEK